MLSGKEVLPLIEGGKGIAVSSGQSSGAWAAAGGVATFSGVNADSFDEDGNIIPQVYHGRTRRDRHDELVAYGIQGGITQAKLAHELSGGNGRIHMNVLWEMGGGLRRLQPTTKSTIIRLSPRHVRFARCGNGPITNSLTGLAALYMRIPGWRVVITA